MKKNMTNASHLYKLLFQKVKKSYFWKKEIITILKPLENFKYFQIHTWFLFNPGMRLKQNTDVLTFNQDVNSYLNVMLGPFVR